MTDYSPVVEQDFVSVDPDTGSIVLHPHEGQERMFASRKRYVVVLAGTQGGKTSSGPWWLYNEIQQCGGGDYLAVTASYDLFKLKMLPEMLNVFEHLTGIGRWWSGAKVIELADPRTGLFLAKKADDPHMWGRIILRSAVAKGGLESATAKAAWLDEAGQDEFRLTAWEAIQRRLSLSRGRVLITTTPYNMGWLKRKLYDQRHANPDIDIINFASNMNPRFSREEFERAKQDLPEWKFQMFYLGIFSRPAGMIYSDFVDAIREDGGHRFIPYGATLPNWMPRYVGVDPGAVHNAMIWLAHDTKHNTYLLYRESLEGRKPIREYAQEALALTKRMDETVLKWAIGQKAELQTRLDWEAAGVKNVVAPEFSDVEAGIDRVIALLRQRRLFISNACTGTLDQLRDYSRELDEMGEPTDRIKNKDKYHYLDALRYAVAQVDVPAKIATVSVGYSGISGRKARR